MGERKTSASALKTRRGKSKSGEISDAKNRIFARRKSAGVDSQAQCSARVQTSNQRSLMDCLKVRRPTGNRDNETRIFIDIGLHVNPVPQRIAPHPTRSESMLTIDITL